MTAPVKVGGAAEVPTGDAGRLALLAGELERGGGWSTTLYGDPPMLRVVRPHVPEVGETITVVRTPGGPWTYPRFG